ncbi:ABC transporter permease [Barrientosiimonas endolithica]|uniref:Transport permease protein n=1 Tax=Barrientosiimonas endolithica TaxID=1535208 RepID=A0ABM8H8E4_9MICO|nr:ABC transporter permease [Barrientosiimonas endolithica]BDZ57167.1 transport permease protein [Barrientosiimonas endolithica]
MNPRITLATTRRVLDQLRADHRTVALILVVPALLLSLLWWVYDGAPIFDRLAVTMLGILPMVVMFLVTSVAMLRERTSGTLERLLTTPMHRADLLLGYAVAFTLMAILQATVLWAVCRWLLGVQTRGPVGWLLIVAAASAAVGVAMGLLASAFARTEFQAVQFMPLVIVPQLFLCGLLVAREAMPQLLQWAANVLPLSYAVEGLRAVGSQTDPSADAVRDALVLAGFALVALTLAAVSMPRKTR